MIEKRTNPLNLGKADEKDAQSVTASTSAQNEKPKVDAKAKKEPTINEILKEKPANSTATPTPATSTVAPKPATATPVQLKPATSTAAPKPATATPVQLKPATSTVAPKPATPMSVQPKPAKNTVAPKPATATPVQLKPATSTVAPKPATPMSVQPKPAENTVAPKPATATPVQPKPAIDVASSTKPAVEKKEEVPAVKPNGANNTPISTKTTGNFEKKLVIALISKTLYILIAKTTKRKGADLLNEVMYCYAGIHFPELVDATFNKKINTSDIAYKINGKFKKQFVMARVNKNYYNLIASMTNKKGAGIFNDAMVCYLAVYYPDVFVKVKKMMSK